MRRYLLGRRRLGRPLVGRRRLVARSLLGRRRLGRPLVARRLLGRPLVGRRRLVGRRLDALMDGSRGRAGQLVSRRCGGSDRSGVAGLSVGAQGSLSAGDGDRRLRPVGSTRFRTDGRCNGPDRREAQVTRLEPLAHEPFQALEALQDSRDGCRPRPGRQGAPAPLQG